MPLLFEQQLENETKLAIWHITEPETYFHSVAVHSRSIHNNHKRLQHLAGRYLLTKLFPDFPLHLIKFSDTKKPFIPGDPFHFSISHAGQYAAAIISKNYRCGIDIEIPQEKIIAIAPKFLSSSQLQVMQSNLASRPLSLTIAWSAKEAVFKWYALGAVDFKDHIVIDHCSINGNDINVHATFTKNSKRSLSIQGKVFDQLVLMWLTTPR